MLIVIHIHGNNITIFNFITLWHWLL